MTSRCRIASSQCWNNLVCINIEIYNYEQRRINVVYFDIDLNIVRQCRNNVVIFSIDFRNVGQPRNNLVNMNICTKLKSKLRVKSITIFLSFKLKWFTLNILNQKSSSLYSLFYRIYGEEYLQSGKNS